MKKIVLCAVAAASVTGAARAENLTFGVDFAVGQWANSDGGSGLESNGGLDGKDERFTSKLGLSVSNDFGMFVGQIDLSYQDLEKATSNLDDDDSTQHIFDVALRGMRDFGNVRAGLFLGYGKQNDYGDSDLNMDYKYIGIDASAPVSFGEVFGQIGYLDSQDEYDEGTQQAPFLRVGAAYNLPADLTLTGAISVAGGRKYGDSDYSNHILGLELGLEKVITDTGLSVYGSYEYTRIYYEESGDPDKFGDTFGTVWLGVKYDLGGNGKRGTKLPNIGQWVAYNANEVE